MVARFGLVMGVLVACGARTGLLADPSPGPGAPDPETPETPEVPDVPEVPEVPAPDCGVAVSPGQIRATVPGIGGPVALDDLGNVYAHRPLADGGHELVSLDPCLRERWTAPLEGAERAGFAIMVDGEGTVWALPDRWPGRRPVRFGQDGRSLPIGFELPDDVFTWIGIDARGPVFSTHSVDRDNLLHRVQEDGTLASVGLPESSMVWSDECLIAAGVAACWDVAYDRGDLTLLWRHDRPRIIDGTLRHVLPPASDGMRLITARYGLSTYDLVAHDLVTGDEVLSVPIARTTQGQVRLLVGPVVLTEGGAIVVYMSGDRDVPPDGRLEAFSATGDRLWSVEAPRTFRGTPVDGIYSGIATHAVGRGVVYLAVGERAIAVDERDGAVLWTLDGLGDVNEPATVLSPDGDLFVRNLDGVLYAIATESAGPARSPWPMAGGSHRAAGVAQVR